MKVLVTANLTEEGIKRLTDKMGFEVEYDPWGENNRLLLADELAERVVKSKADAIIIEVDLCHEEVFEAKQLEFIGCCRADPLIVDLDMATERGTPVFFTPGRNAEAVADLTAGLIIMHLRKLLTVCNLLKSGTFEPETPAEFMAMLKSWSGDELNAKTVGIVGLGAVGREVAKRVRAFGCHLVAFDPFAPDERFAEYNAAKVSLEDLFAASDIITLHAADTDENEGMITRALIGSMKPGALFVNLARAQLVDQDALYEALSQKRIGGAALDVFMNEPPSSDDRFVRLDNVIATPHIGGTTRDVIRHQTDILLSDLEAYLAGRTPRFCANPEALKKKRG